MVKRSWRQSHDFPLIKNPVRKTSPSLMLLWFSSAGLNTVSPSLAPNTMFPSCVVNAMPALYSLAFSPKPCIKLYMPCFFAS